MRQTVTENDWHKRPDHLSADSWEMAIRLWKAIMLLTAIPPNLIISFYGMNTLDYFIAGRTSVIISELLGYLKGYFLSSDFHVS